MTDVGNVDVKFSGDGWGWRRKKREEEGLVEWRCVDSGAVSWALWG